MNERFPRRTQREFPRRDNFATRNELKTQEVYGKYPSPIAKRSQI